jgi:hypothetical protein
MSRVQEFMIQIAPSVFKLPTTDEQKEQIAASFETVSNVENFINSLHDKRFFFISFK